MESLVGAVSQFLLGILGIQRFLLYFFPSTEKYVNLSDATMKKVIVIVSLIFEGQTFLEFSFALVYYDFLITLNTVYQVCLNVVIFTSALLYIPIFISLRKVAHLESVRLNNPKRYVLWQLLVIVVTKTLIIIYYLLMIASGFMDPLFFQGNLEASDLYCTPLIIQITYLGCNKRNWEIVWNLLKNRKEWRKVLCPWSGGADVGVMSAGERTQASRSAVVMDAP